MRLDKKMGTLTAHGSGRAPPLPHKSGMVLARERIVPFRAVPGSCLPQVDGCDHLKHWRKALYEFATHGLFCMEETHERWTTPAQRPRSTTMNFQGSLRMPPRDSRVFRSPSHMLRRPCRNSHALRAGLEIRGSAAAYFVAIDKGHFADAGLAVEDQRRRRARSTRFRRSRQGPSRVGFADINSLMKFLDQNPGAPVTAR